MKNYLRSFFKEEDGAEMFEIAIGLLCAAILIGIVFAIYNSVKSKMTAVQDTVDSIEMPT